MVAADLTQAALSNYGALAGGGYWVEGFSSAVSLGAPDNPANRDYSLLLHNRKCPHSGAESRCGLAYIPWPGLEGLKLKLWPLPVASQTEGAIPAPSPRAFRAHNNSTKALMTAPAEKPFPDRPATLPEAP